jgi:hypothetical protein
MTTPHQQQQPLTKQELQSLHSQLVSCYGNISIAASIAGVSAPTLYRWLDKGIPKSKQHIITKLLPDNLPDTETTATPLTTSVATPNNAVLLLQVFITTPSV